MSNNNFIPFEPTEKVTLKDGLIWKQDKVQLQVTEENITKKKSKCYTNKITFEMDRDSFNTIFEKINIDALISYLQNLMENKDDKQ